MKMISKLMTTSALLLAGALVSFGADMDAKDMKTTAPATKMADMKLNDSDYKEIIGSMTVEQFVDKLKTNDRFMKFAKIAEQKLEQNNPKAAKEVKDFVEKNKNTKLKDLDKEKLKAAFKEVVPTFKAKMAEVKKDSKSAY